MAYDEDLADRIRLLLGERHLVEKRMFGGLAFLLHGHLAVCASGQGGLLVRTDPEQTEQLRERPDTQPFVTRGTPMRGWLRVEGATLDDDSVLRSWVECGVTYAGSLPPKPVPTGRSSP